MNQAHQILLNLIESMPEEKILQILSYANFLKQESDNVLLLESDDEEEINNIIQNDEYYSESDTDNILNGKVNV